MPRNIVPHKRKDIEIFHSLPHVLAVEHRVAAMALEAPYVPLSIQRYQSLAFPQLVSATGAGTGVGWPVSGSSGGGIIADRRRGLSNRDTDASVTQSLTYRQRTFS